MPSVKLEIYSSWNTPEKSDMGVKELTVFHSWRATRTSTFSRWTDCVFLPHQSDLCHTKASFSCWFISAETHWSPPTDQISSLTFGLSEQYSFHCAISTVVKTPHHCVQHQKWHRIKVNAVLLGLIYPSTQSETNEYTKLFSDILYKYDVFLSCFLLKC